MFKKLISLLMVITLLLPMFLTGSNQVYASTAQNVDFQDASASDIIKAIKPHVEVTKEGTIRLKKLPKHFHEKYNLEGLQKHFDNLNALVETGDITINKDLSIQDNSISTMSEYGKWTYHWWGYDRKFTDAQAKDYINELLTVAAGATIVAGIGAYFPPVAGIATIQAGY